MRANTKSNTNVVCNRNCILKITLVKDRIKCKGNAQNVQQVLETDFNVRFQSDIGGERGSTDLKQINWERDATLYADSATWACKERRATEYARNVVNCETGYTGDGVQYGTD